MEGIKPGTIDIFLGCMYSGKTDELIREKSRWEAINVDVLTINYDEDTRFGIDEFLYSHNKNKSVCHKVHKLGDIKEDMIKSKRVILINEGQFFTDLKEKALEWCEKYGKHIIVSGLDGDFNREKFGQLLDLIPLADSVTKIKAFCKLCNDGTKAIFSHRLSHEKEQKVIGASNYIPVCRMHYIKCKTIDAKEEKLKSSSKKPVKKTNG
jgi:thymidine kinase